MPPLSCKTQYGRAHNVSQDGDMESSPRSSTCSPEFPAKARSVFPHLAGDGAKERIRRLKLPGGVQNHKIVIRPVL